MFPIHDDTPRMNGRPYVNYGLIAINIIVFIYEVIITSNFANRLTVVELYSNYGSIPDLILSGQNLASLFSSMFMHGSIAHLLGNMFFLYVFGDNLEDRFGHFRYLLLYLFWGVLASFAHGIYAVSTGGGDVPAIGASGAISGVLGAYLIFYPHAKIHTIIFAFFITTVRIPAIAYIPFWFIMQILFAFIGQSGGVAYLAHIGGFMIGLLSAYLWKMFSNMLSGSRFKQRQIYRPRSSFYDLDNANTRNYPRPNTDTDILKDRMVQPELIVGENFVDVIIESKSITDKDQMNVEFDKITKTLYIRDGYSQIIGSVIIPTENLQNFSVSDVSVKNGIIKVRLN
jgi:membrane associated rhomboid family serine protease